MTGVVEPSTAGGLWMTQTQTPSRITEDQLCARLVAKTSPAQTRNLVQLIATRYGYENLERVWELILTRVSWGPRHLKAVVEVGGGAFELEPDVFQLFPDTKSATAALTQLLHVPGFDEWTAARVLSCPSVAYVTPQAPQLVASFGWCAPAAAVLLGGFASRPAGLVTGGGFAARMTAVAKRLQPPPELSWKKRVPYAQVCLLLASGWSGTVEELVATATGIVVPGSRRLARTDELD